MLDFWKVERIRVRYDLFEYSYIDYNFNSIFRAILVVHWL